MKPLVVIKVGTSTVTLPDGSLHEQRISLYADALSVLMAGGHRVVLVTSGAVGAGRGRLGMTYRPRQIEEKQAAAAVGQGILIRTYEHHFSRHGRLIAQVLLTRSDLADRQRCVNARNTMLTLLNRFGVVPIINENDTIAVEELKFGDNDTLSARVAAILGADWLIVCTDTDGLYSADPRRDPSARRLVQVERITPAIRALAGGAGSDAATGGMMTKIQAAQIATSSGVRMVITHGAHPHRIPEILLGRPIGTTFLPQAGKLESRKSWIAYGAPVRGQLAVDPGAAEAIRTRGKSLLPAGVVAVSGEFERGDTVSVYMQRAQGSGIRGQESGAVGDVEIARGLINYSSEEIQFLVGARSTDIEKILGYSYAPELIHRDNLVLL